MMRENERKMLIMLKDEHEDFFCDFPREMLLYDDDA